MTKLFFNANNGKMEDIPENEINDQEQYMIPLLRKPNPRWNCKKCYGRMFIGHHVRRTLDGFVHDYYMPCNSCLRKCIDEEFITKSMEDMIKSQNHQETDD